MKKIVYIASICAFLATQTACSPQFEDLFDKSASERLQESMENAQNVLTAAEKGWSMGYFPNTSTRGYILFAKFAADGHVTLTDYNNKGLTSTSTYSMNISQGPVLNFDTYSDVLGHYTDPGTWLGGATGNAGDFEFVIFSVSENEVVLKGKQYGAKAVLRKIEGNGDEATLWREHFDACEAMYGKLFANGVSPVLKVADVPYYTLTNPTSRKFEMYPYGSTNVEEMTPLSYIASTTGIDLAENFLVGGKSVRSFVYDETNGVLVAKEDTDVVIDAPDVYGYFATAGIPYIADGENVYGKFSDSFVSLAKDFNEQYAGKRDLQGVGFMASNGQLIFVVQALATRALFTIPGQVLDDKVVVEPFDAFNFPAADMDKNATLFYNQVAGLKAYLALLPGEYRMENKGGLLLPLIEFVSIENESNRMLLHK